MRPIRNALAIGASLLGIAGGCDGGPSAPSDAVRKQNFEDELKAMKNAEDASKDAQGRRLTKGI